MSRRLLIVIGSGASSRLKAHAAEMHDRLRRAKIVEIPSYDYGIHLLTPDAGWPRWAFLREFA